ncbi:hypothetical protein JXA12_01185 [Candidatus Woesearchaeota archaeon]|nr:hypothetical protein [Candidatus Woesearchaeota archaeon]
MNLREVHDDKIKRLAETLKNNGLAASETEAIRMATNMTGTEKKVTENMDQKREREIAMQQRPRPQQQEAAPAAPPSQPWEKEVQAQGGPAPEQAPAPTHDNQALNQAISNVQERFTNDPQHADPRQERPQLERMTVEEAAAPEPEAPAPEAARPVVERPLPLETPTPATAAPVEEEDIPEKTREIHDRPPRRDSSGMAESRVNLSDVFNVNRN